MKKILIAPDSFKGSISAIRFCEVAVKAINTFDPSIIVDSVPMADGGEGSVEALVYNSKGRIVECQVKGPLFENHIARYGILGDEKTAIIEMAEASGLALLLENDQNPMLTTTYGVGQLVLDAIDQGCNNLIIGIGGSATNDGGMGMMSALGCQFLDDKGQRLMGKGNELAQISSIEWKAEESKLKNIAIKVACDVDNPLLGEKGAAYVYAPQKGANPKMVLDLDNGLAHFASKVYDYLGVEIADRPGAGAAGGLGAGIMGFLDGKLSPGFEIISETLGLDQRIRNGNYDLILTGEGQMNNQTMNGKLPLGIARLGKKNNVPVIGIVGGLGRGYEEIFEEGMLSVFSIMNKPMSLETAFKESENLLEDTIIRVLKVLNW